MIEWILVVWLIVGGPENRTLAPAFEVGTYRFLDAWEKSAAAVRVERHDVEFIALCIERDK